jgi:hypothetical protein
MSMKGKIIDAARRLSKRVTPTALGAEFDYLASDTPTSAPPFHAFPPIKRAAVVATMRNEGIVLLEWIAHYRVLGFDTIIIYTNDNSDGSDDLLLALHRAGIIKLIQNSSPPGLSAQLKAYRHAFWFSEDVWAHEWVTFLDADEFLIPLIHGRFAAIGEYTDYITRTYGCSAVSLNWRWFRGDLKFERDLGLLFERFRDSKWDNHVKTLFRVRDAVNVAVHCPALLPGMKAVGGSGSCREVLSDHETPDGTLGQVNHYWQRSFQEFFVKRERGRGGPQRSPRAWSTFFEWGEVGTPDPHPGTLHIAHVRAEMELLLKHRSIRTAFQQVNARFEEYVRHPAVEALYAAAIEARAPQSLFRSD